MRTRHKMWRNDRGSKWSARIIWFQGEDENDVRLEMMDCERETNVYPKTREEADHIWFMFKQGAPERGTEAGFIADLLELLSKKYPHLAT